MDMDFYFIKILIINKALNLHRNICFFFTLKVFKLLTFLFYRFSR